MPYATIYVPDDKYAQFHRMLAELIDGHLDAEVTRASGGPGGVDLGVDEPRPRWRIQQYSLNDDDFSRLVTYYRRLSPHSRRIHDLLIDDPDEIRTGQDLATSLGLDTQYAVAGSLGHAGRYAAELHRPFPIDWNRDTGEYHVDPELREALKHARLWTVSSPYTHRVYFNNELYLVEELEEPNRFALIRDEAVFGMFHDREVMLSAHPQAFDEEEYAVLEFRPDHDDDELVAEPRPNEPPLAWTPGA